MYNKLLVEVASLSAGIVLAVKYNKKIDNGKI